MMILRKTIRITLLHMLLASSAWAQEAELPEADDHWLAERAASSDVVAVTQLERTDYEYRRNFPVNGRTWFRVLFDYKTPREMERLIVLENGLKPDHGCYFPDIPIFEEQPRYLLFLNYDEERALRGHVDGCAVEIAVTKQGGYAALWPQRAFEQTIAVETDEPVELAGTEMILDPVLEALTQPMEFQGPLSRLDGSQMVNHLREARAEAENLRIEGTDLVYTRGIALSELRQLMWPGLMNSPGDQRRRIEAIRRVLEDSPF